MKLYLDTSTSTTILRLDDREYTWESGHDLAENLHAYIRDRLAEQTIYDHSAEQTIHDRSTEQTVDGRPATWTDITEITFMSGPGSFTGLRIGASVVNALADQLNIPLYDHLGQRHPVIIPNYGRPANIGTPKK